MSGVCKDNTLKFMNEGGSYIEKRIVMQMPGEKRKDARPRTAEIVANTTAVITQFFTQCYDALLAIEKEH